MVPNRLFRPAARRPLRALAALVVALSAAALAAPQPIRGVVLDRDTDAPVAYARILFDSGKELLTTDRQGRFETELPASEAKLRVEKPGYEALPFRTDEYPDPLDLQLFLKRNVKKLKGERVTAEAAAEDRAVELAPIRELERVQGMQFDLQEHLAFLPGVSGLQEFSSNISHYGSRSQDVSNYLGSQRIPALRHIDIGFPGNLSAINPRVLEGVSLVDAPGGGPIDQGRSAAIQFRPAAGDPERYAAVVGLGTAVSEAVVSGPWLWGDGFEFSFRWLNSAFLTNLGSRFFTEYRKRGADVGKDDDLSATGSDFELTAFDLYLNLHSTDSDGVSTRTTLLWVHDDWDVMQDTSHSFSAADNGPRLSIFEGTRDAGVLSWERTDSAGFGLHLGAVWEGSNEQYRDDETVIYIPKNAAAPRKDGSDNLYGDEAGLLGDLDRTAWTVQGGAESPLRFRLLGAGTAWGADLQWMEETREERYSPLLKKAESDLGTAQLQGRMLWKNDRWNNGLSLGATATTAGEALPNASLSLDRRLAEGLDWTADLGWKSQALIVPGKFDAAKHSPSLDGKLFGSGELRSGFEWTRGRLRARARGFGRWYLEPELPSPEVLWFFDETRSADRALVFGANAGADWSTAHRFLLSVNASTVRGDYYLADGGAIPWEAQRDLDMTTAMRFYPRSDTLISVILKHRASWGQPTYSYGVRQYLWGNAGSGGGERTIRHEGEISTFRTDLRLHLDLTSKIRPLKSARFYLELDNLFAKADIEALRWLGGDNERQRGWKISRDGNLADQRFDLEPFVGKGMGLFVQFGVEGTF